MTTNEELTVINDKLTEAGTEIPALIDQLLAQVAAGDPADPVLVAAIKEKAQGLANIVPDAPVEPPVVEEPVV